MADVKKVLVVDDHFEMLEFLQSMLELSEYDYEVLAVPSAEEGMLELGRTTFDILITDVRLPGMSGFDFVRRARKRARNTDLPVIMITAYASDQGRQEAKELGVYRYFTKPFSDTDEVITAVNEILYGSPPATDTEDVVTIAAHVDITLPASVSKRLQTLTTDTGAALVLLATKKGQMLVETGVVRDVDIEQLSTIISSNLINSKQLTEQLGGDVVTTIQYHAGEHLEMYTANVGADYFMSIIFDVHMRRGRFGTMWVFTQRAIKDLLRMLPVAGAVVKERVEKTAVSPKKTQKKAQVAPSKVRTIKPADTIEPEKPKKRRGYAIHPDSASAGNIERAAKPAGKVVEPKDDKLKFSAPLPPDFSSWGEEDDSDALSDLGADGLASLLGNAPAKTEPSPDLSGESESDLVPMDADALKNLMGERETAVSDTEKEPAPIPPADDLAHLLALDDAANGEPINLGEEQLSTADTLSKKKLKPMSFAEAQRLGLLGGATLPADDPEPVADTGLDDMLQNLENPVDLDAFWDTAISSSTTDTAKTGGLSLEEARRQGFLSGDMGE